MRRLFCRTNLFFLSSRGIFCCIHYFRSLSSFQLKLLFVLWIGNYCKYPITFHLKETNLYFFDDLCISVFISFNFSVFLFLSLCSGTRGRKFLGRKQSEENFIMWCFKKFVDVCYFILLEWFEVFLFQVYLTVWL